jgi:tetratricopeptide (TPR) repeat protein
MKKLIGLLILSAALLSCSKSDDYLKKGKDAFDQKNYELAIANFDSVLQLSPDHAEALATRGSARYNIDDYQGAISDCTKSIEYWPKDNQNDAELGKIYADLADCYFNVKLYDAAIDNYTIAVTKNEKLAIAYSGRGDAYIAKSNPQLAQPDFEKAISIDPNFASAHYGLGNVKFDQKDFAGAIPHYSQAIALNPTITKYFMDRGDSFYMTEEYAKAADDFSSAIALDPTNAKAYVFRGDAKDEQGLAQEAIKDYIKALEINPDYGLAYYNMGVTKQRLKDKVGACDAFKKALNAGYQEAEPFVKECR